MTGSLVFDIQRFALRDGPGIRTTVFLKGCPLRCLWCHNPESQTAHVEYAFDYEKCYSCLEEGNICPNGVKSVILRKTAAAPDAEGRLAVKAEYIPVRDRTLLRADCVGRCPRQAVKRYGESFDTERILGIVEEDMDFYRTTGGGLTVSGGEPLVQMDFLEALLKGARQRGIHTCLETTGYAPLEHIRRIMPWTDMFLYDYKATEEHVHKQLTGVGNKQILDNLQFLHDAGAKMILRCPLVPGVNDSDLHLQGIAALARRLSGLTGIEIMAYHDIGVFKYERLGRTNPLTLPTASEAVKKRWTDTLRDLGCRAVIG